MPDNLQAIVLAGGRSKRFNTGKTKLTEKICGKAMILYPIDLLQKMNIPTTMVVGFQQEKILEALTNHGIKGIDFVQQFEQLGTGHALQVSEKKWNKEHILVLNADIPLMTEEVIQKLYNKHVKTDSDISFITSHAIDYANDGYCRIVINDNKIHVLERRDENIDIDMQCCISGGIYIIKKSFLQKYIHQLTKSSLTGEYYLPELIQIASNENCKIITTPVSFDIARGVNTLAELWVVEHIKRSQIISYWMNNGVRFAISLNVLIDTDVVLEPGVYIGSGAHLLGKTTIKKNATVEAFSYIVHSVIEEHATVKSHTVIEYSKVGKQAVIHPFSNLQYQQVHETPREPVTISSPLFTGAIKDESELNNLT